MATDSDRRSLKRKLTISFEVPDDIYVSDEENNSDTEYVESSSSDLVPHLILNLFYQILILSLLTFRMTG